MKTCNQCGVVKDCLDFHKRSDAPDGFRHACKVCVCASSKAWYKANPEQKAATNKVWQQANPEKRAADNKAYRQANPERHAANTKADRLRYPEKYKARSAVRNAIRDGRLTRPNECSSCNVSCKPEGHHDNYDEPLNVRWLCKACHTAHHNQLNQLQEA